MPTTPVDAARMPTPPVDTTPVRALAGAAWAAGAPLALWTLHFVLMYGGVAVACLRHVDARWAGMPAVTLALGASTAVLLGAVVALGVRGPRPGCDGRVATGAALRRGAALLAAVGIAWNAVPLLLVPPCGA